MRNKIITSLILLLSSVCMQSADLKLWYQQPANEWMKALPIGNGRLGGMIYGKTDTEIIALNEITMWSGQYDVNQYTACGKDKIKRIRQQFFDGKPIDGNGSATNGFKSKSSSIGTHLPIGDLKIRFNHYNRDVKNYERSLDLTTAVTSVSYNYKNTNYKREYICSNPDQVMAIHLTADRSSSINFELSLNLLREATISMLGNDLEFSGTSLFPKLGPGGVEFVGKIRIIANKGKVYNDTRCDNEPVLIVKDADDVTILVDIRTDYKNDFLSGYKNTNYKDICSSEMADAANKSFDQLKQNHINDYSKLYSRVELSLGQSDNDNLPTDIRWKQIKQGSVDPGFDALFFQYGRYLLIASSRENSPLPANLQGLWNDNLACNMGWTCDYHLDINTEQNYWASNVTNLPECNAPWFNYIRDLSVSGEKAARTIYGSPGWVVHTASNAWGYTGIGEGMAWSMFSASTAWITTHLWTQFAYTRDTVFLKDKAYPIIKKASEFFLDYMTVNPYNGYLMTGPSNSPENTFKFNGWELAMSMMTTADRTLVFELLSDCIESSKILNIDTDFRSSLEQALYKFPPIKIGKNGGVQEWFEDYEDAHPNHRHTSHLLGFYPYSQITLDKSPDLAVAVRKTIENKLNATGWEDVEFSRANTTLFYSRLKDSGEAYKNFHSLLRDFTRENLFTMSPAGIAGAPYDIFIFDGNEAGTAAVAEMLVQSHQGYIEFLPALPAAWKSGYIKGLCVRGGAKIDLEWENFVVKKAILHATAKNTFNVKIPGSNNTLKKELHVGESWNIMP